MDDLISRAAGIEASIDGADDMMKQYTVFRIDSFHYHIYLFNNGHLEARTKVDDRDLCLYTCSFEAVGYQRAYFVPWYEQEEDLARLRYKRAAIKHKEAQCHPLKIDDESAGQFVEWIACEESVFNI